MAAWLRLGGRQCDCPGLPTKTSNALYYSMNKYNIMYGHQVHIQVGTQALVPGTVPFPAPLTLLVTPIPDMSSACFLLPSVGPLCRRRVRLGPHGSTGRRMALPSSPPIPQPDLLGGQHLAAKRLMMQFDIT